MGLPVPVGEEQDEGDLIKIIEDHANDCYMLHLLSHRDATAWIWPFFSREQNKDIWEFIPDDVISDIIRDLNTGEVIMIIADERITIKTAENTTSTIRRKRTFTRKLVKIEWSENGTAITGLVSGIFKNPTGIMPIPFANNRDGDEVRGHSDYERIISDLKNYHDTDLSLSELLTKFSPKMIQEVQNVDDWKKANGITSMADINIASLDFIINLFDKERTTFEWPAGAHEAGMAKLTQIFWKLVQGSGIPEIFWGTKVQGNYASADNQVDMAIQFVEDKQRQKNEPYKQLISATAQLRNIARMDSTVPVVTELKWNALDLLSETAKIDIFSKFASGLSALITSAGITKEQAYKIYQRMFPYATEASFDDFRAGLGEMAKHKAFSNTPYEIIADLNGSMDDSSGI
jgi:hypothetical protein